MWTSKARLVARVKARLVAVENFSKVRLSVENSWGCDAIAPCHYSGMASKFQESKAAGCALALERQARSGSG
jgi:hypothetical protein